MALAPSAPPIQIINYDLAIERQRILREKLRELFAGIGKKSRNLKKELIYTLNRESTALEIVLRANEGADALFTAFNYDATTSEEFKDQLVVNSRQDSLKVDPKLRYPIIGEFQSLIDRGHFRHRKLVLVGDIHEKIHQVLLSGLPVEVSVFSNAERTQATQLMEITSIDRIYQGSDPAAAGDKIAVSQINLLRIADIPFNGIINMPERANRFELKDNTLLDTTRKLLTMEGVREVMTREQLQEEQLTFVRGKKVFIVLEEDLDYVISDRLIFDKMTQLFRHHNLQQALHTLETGKSRGIVDFFETQGYDLVFEVLSQEERDAFLVTVLGNRLAAMLEKELQSQKGNLAILDDSEIEQIFYKTPEAVLNQVLEGVKALSQEKFLALVPVKIRESVIVDFLGNSAHAASAWQGMAVEDKKEILNTQAPLILAHLNLTKSKFFQAKFPDIQFEFARNYDSAQLSQMSAEDQTATFSLFVKSLEKARPPQGAIARTLKGPEIGSAVVDLIQRHPAEVYNRLNPVVRRQLWITVGKEYQQHITRSLHFLDMVEILKGNKEAALDLLFKNPAFLAALKTEDSRELAVHIFLSLKKTNKTESKNALLKRVLTTDEWKPNRVKSVPVFLSAPDNQGIYDKLAEHVEGLDFTFDSLICTKAEYEVLKEQEPLRDVPVTLIDDLVDPTLVNLFKNAKLTREDYDTFRQSVEEEIEKLRAKMGKREAEDPVGVYVLETMQVLGEMTNQAMSGKLDADAVEKLDARQQIRKRLIASLKDYIRKIEGFLAKADAQVTALEKKIAEAEKLTQQHGKVYDEALKRAQGLMAGYQKLQRTLQQSQVNRKKVALTQKQLSLQFFDITQPLILEQVRKLSGPLQKLLRAVGVGRQEEQEALARRVIFKFTDEEIANILRFNIVFTTKDEILMQFILTCLRIDNLQDSLFSLVSLENLPRKGIDILFYGPGYDISDFEGLVQEKRIVPFADEVFYQRLLSNEKLKATTKANLARLDQEMGAQKKLVEVANRDMGGKQHGSRQVELAFNNLKSEKTKLLERIEKQKEQRHRFHGEQELLESRLAEVDTRFEEVKAKVAEAVAQGGETITTVTEGQGTMAGGLQEDLLKIQQDLAHMMFIKGVKDAGDQISKGTQTEMLNRMQARERYLFKERPFKRMIAADDGSLNGKNIKRMFLNLVPNYFRLNEMSIEDLSLRRLDGRAESTNDADYPFIAVFADTPEDDFAELRRIVRRVRSNMPGTFQMLFAPIGEVWKLDPKSEAFKNIRSLKENGCLINTGIIDFTNPANLLRVLQEKAPRD